VQTSALVLRVRNAPTRAGAALFTFGLILGLPAFLCALGAIAFAAGIDALGTIFIVLGFFSFFAAVILLWIFIFQARSRIQRSQEAIYAGDLERAVRESRVVLRTVFRSDYQMSALFTLALAAERAGAFADAATLFVRAFEMIPAMAAQGPGRRVRSLILAHAALDFAAVNDLASAHQRLAQCNAQLASAASGGTDFLFDDSKFGAIGINSLLNELESKRDPRPLAVLATLTIWLKNGLFSQLLDLLNRERGVLAHGLAQHEQALVARVESEALRLSSGAGPHRSPAAMQGAGDWASWIVP